MLNFYVFRVKLAEIGNGMLVPCWFILYHWGLPNDDNEPIIEAWLGN
uniref:Uncharacterized protein n=1 Tax=Rhizophora mucronata TaxID=61149 RepID=A0A2P2PUV2_RHIMU